MKIAVVGCGYVFDHYMETLPDHPELELAGVFDRDPDRLQTVGTYFGIPTYGSLDELLADRGVELVVNLTDPDSHYPVSKAALLAGKHVYSEKPWRCAWNGLRNWWRWQRKGICCCIRPRAAP